MAFALRIAEAKPGDRKHQVGQVEHGRDLVDLVADHADRADAEPGGFGAQDHRLHRERGIDAGVEEAFERAVADRLAAQLADALQPPRVAEKDEEDRRHADPGHAREQRADRGALGRIADPQDRGLLEVRFRRRAQGRGDQQVEQASFGIASL